MKILFLYMFVFILLSCSCLAQEPICDEEIPHIFVIAETGAPCYQAEHGEAMSSYVGVIGDLFHGVQHGQLHEHERIQLGKYDITTKKFDSIIGWVPKKYLLVSYYATTVGQAVEQGYLASSTSLDSSAFTVNNELPLRILTRPECNIVATVAPGSSQENRPLPSFTWYEVMKLSRDKKGTIYCLLADRNQIVNDNYTGTESEAEIVKSKILGWAEFSKVFPWPTNLMFEISTEKNALMQRYNQNLPAKVFSSPNEDSDIVPGIELLALYQEYMQFGDAGDITKLKLARADPYGLSLEIPRLHVMERVSREEEWYKVASLGSTSRNISSGEIGRLMEKVKQAQDHLQAVDICFAIDGSASMRPTIDSIQQFCQALSEASARAAQDNADCMKIMLPSSKESMNLDIKMDIRISLVVYYDVAGYPNSGTQVIFAGVPVEKQQVTIDEGFEKLKEKLDASQEDLHGGLYKALTTPEIWRPYSLRFIVVLTDEEGVSQEQDKVWQAMPLPNLTIAKKLGLNIEKITQDNFKREYTKIIAIYTASDCETTQQNYDYLKDNLKKLTDIQQNVTWIPNIEQEKSQIKIIQTMTEYLQKWQTRIQERLDALLAQMRDSNSTSSGLSDLPVSWYLDQIQLQEIFDNLQLTSNDQDTIKRTAAFEGYIKVQQTAHGFPTYRKRVLLSERELIELRNNVIRFTSSLNKSLSKKNINKTPSQIIAEAMVLAIAQVTDTSDEFQDPERLREAGQALIQEALYDDGGINIVHKLNMRKSFPFDPQGILGMPLQKVISLRINEVKLHKELLEKKLECLERIINGEIAPEIQNQDFSILINFPHNGKDWFYKHPISDLRFAYVPIEYMP